MAERFDAIITNDKLLAEYLGCSVNAVCQFRNGKSFPKHKNLIKIAKFYGVSVDYLLGLTDSKQPYLSVSEYTGLTEKAIDSIRNLDGKTLAGLNRFLEGISEK